MALVDPRLLETFRPPPPMDAIGKVMRGVDADMTSILDRIDLDDGEKVHLYNQVLQRCNALSDRCVKQPTSVVVVNDDDTSRGTERRRRRRRHRSQDHADRGQNVDGASQKRRHMDRSRRVDIRRRAGSRKQHDGSRQ